MAHRERESRLSDQARMNIQKIRRQTDASYEEIGDIYGISRTLASKYAHPEWYGKVEEGRFKRETTVQCHLCHTPVAHARPFIHKVDGSILWLCGRCRTLWTTRNGIDPKIEMAAKGIDPHEMDRIFSEFEREW